MLSRAAIVIALCLSLSLCVLALEETQLYPAKISIEHEKDHAFVEAEIIDRDAPAAAAAAAASSFRALGSQQVDRSLSETHAAVSPVGGACKSPAGAAGVCKNVAQCSGQTFSGLCAGNSQIKCCVEGRASSSSSSSSSAAPAADVAPSRNQCTYGGQMGECKEQSTCKGATVSGLCPGRASIKCCLASTNSRVAPAVYAKSNKNRITQTTLQRLSETQHQLKWQRFKTIRRKTYATPQAERTAYLIWRQNRVKIIYLNDRYGAGYALFKSSTAYADVATSRFNAQRLGNKVEAPGSSFLETGVGAEVMMETDSEPEGLQASDVHWNTFQTTIAEAARLDAESGVSTDEFLPAASLIQLEQEQGPVAPDNIINSGATVTGKMVVDYRNENLSVRNQDRCGSCWTFAAAAVLESQMIRSGMTPSDHLSTQWFLDCDKDPKQLKCQGGFVRLAFNSLKTQNAVLNYESEYPYQAWPNDGGCTAAAPGGSAMKVTDFNIGVRCFATAADMTCDANNQQALLDLLKAKGSLSISVDASNWQFYEGGIYPDTGCRHGWRDGNHAVVLVGFGEENGQQFWLIRNSWAPYWGEQGHIRIAANLSGAGNGACGAANMAVWATVGKA